MSISSNADDKLYATSEPGVYRKRRRKIESPITTVETKSLASFNSSIRALCIIPPSSAPIFPPELRNVTPLLQCKTNVPTRLVYRNCTRSPPIPASLGMTCRRIMSSLLWYLQMFGAASTRRKRDTSLFFFLKTSVPMPSFKYSRGNPTSGDVQ